MKKFRLVTLLAIITVALIGLFAAGCGSTTTASNESPDTEAVEAKTDVAEEAAISEETTEAEADETTVEIELPYVNPSGDEFNEIRWPSSGLADLIPIPKSTIGEVSENTSTYLFIYVELTSEDDYYDYVDECMNSGFSVKYSQYDDAFYAYNEEGYHIGIWYDEDNQEMRINVQDNREDNTEE